MEEGGSSLSDGGIPHSGQENSVPVYLIRSFINTREIAEGTDMLSSPELLRKWLAEAGLPGGSDAPDPGDLEWVIAIREALRNVLQSHNDGSVPHASIGVLNRAARRAQVTIRFDPQGNPEIKATQDGVAGAVGTILAAVEQARVDGTWERLKACRREDCRWVFFDRSKNRSGTWCSTKGCGSLMKARAYRRRRATGKRQNE